MRNRLISTVEAARRSGLHRITIIRKARSPKDPFPPLIRISRSRHAVEEQAFEAWIATQREPSKSSDGGASLPPAL